MSLIVTIIIIKVCVSFLKEFITQNKKKIEKKCRDTIQYDQKLIHVYLDYFTQSNTSRLQCLRSQPILFSEIS